MKKRKIRGHKRRQRDIARWRLENLELRLDLVEKYQYQYVKVFIHPWCDISMIKSEFPEPVRKTKRLILTGLIDIYHSWKTQLDNIGQSYYLKIWLFEQRFSKSQVVCSIGNRIDYYENLFFRPAQEKPLRSNSYGYLKDRLGELKWEYRYDEDHIESDYVGARDQYLTDNDFLEVKRWFDKTMKVSHRTTTMDNDMEYDSFKKGDLWLGSCNSSNSSVK